MAYRQFIHKAAQADLDAIWEIDPRSAGVLAATLRQIKHDQRLLDSLTVRGFGAYETEAIHVDRWLEQQRLGRNLWRLKHWELESRGRRYRVV